jgi:hypothetical protein
MPTPALVVMSIPPSPQVHVSLGKVVRHLSVAAPSDLGERNKQLAALG